MKYKKLAWELLRSRYWTVFVVTLIVVLIMGAGPVGFILGGPALVGYYGYLKKITMSQADGKHYQDVVTVAASNRFVDYMLSHILKMVFTALWSLLFFIPGIIKALAYSLSERLLLEDPSLSAIDAITKSREIMNGHKMEFFLLILSFLGWFILGALAFGIGIFFVLPYFYMSVVAYQDELIKGANLNLIQN